MTEKNPQSLTPLVPEGPVTKTELLKDREFLDELAELLSDMLANPVNKSHEDFVEMFYDTLCERIWNNLFENALVDQVTDHLLESDTFIERATDHIY
jgi:hypothetical protein